MSFTVPQWLELVRMMKAGELDNPAATLFGPATVLSIKLESE